jgi:hypothetical protein
MLARKQLNVKLVWGHGISLWSVEHHAFCEVLDLCQMILREWRKSTSVAAV